MRHLTFLIARLEASTNRTSGREQTRTACTDFSAANPAIHGGMQPRRCIRCPGRDTRHPWTDVYRPYRQNPDNERRSGIDDFPQSPCHGFFDDELTITGRANFDIGVLSSAPRQARHVKRITACGRRCGYSGCVVMVENLLHRFGCRPLTGWCLSGVFCSLNSRHCIHT
jgi:hypothetical protein